MKTARKSSGPTTPAYSRFLVSVSLAAPDRLSRKLRARINAELAEDVDEVRLHGSARDEQPSRYLGVAQVLADQPRDLELAGSEAGPASRWPLSLAAAPCGVGDRLIDGQLRAFRARSRELIRAERLLCRRDGSLVAWDVDGKAGVVEPGPPRIRGCPEPDRLLVTVLVAGQPGQQLQPVDEADLVVGVATQTQSVVHQRLRLGEVALPH